LRQGGQPVDVKELYPSMEAAAHSMAGLYAPAIKSTARERGLTEPEISILLAVPTFGPEGVTAAQMNVRGRYTSPVRYEELFHNLAQKGILEIETTEQYRLTRQGLDVLKNLLRSIYSAMAGLRAMEETDLIELADRLKQLSDACLNAPDPPGKWSILHAKKLDPGAGADAMVRIDQYLSEVRAYRDDAHLAVWNEFESNGHAWEILTILWSEGVVPIISIQKMLKHRSFNKKQTRAAVDQLEKKGWAAVNGDQLMITDAGIMIRETAEKLTDRYFYAPFASFGDEHHARLLELLNRHRRGIPHPN